MPPPEPQRPSHTVRKSDLNQLRFTGIVMRSPVDSLTTVARGSGGWIAAMSWDGRGQPGGSTTPASGGIPSETAWPTVSPTSGAAASRRTGPPSGTATWRSRASPK